MAKYNRRFGLVEKTFCFALFGKRFCDCSEDEIREYNRIRKAESRKKDAILEKERIYRKKIWSERNESK